MEVPGRAPTRDMVHWIAIRYDGTALMVERVWLVSKLTLCPLSDPDRVARTFDSYVLVSCMHVCIYYGCLANSTKRC